MKELNLGRILLEHRHKRGITQEDLASYLGVSKAAVSKWETGTAYPDILLLPRLASFFNISIDNLMGYDPQMSPEDIRTLYRKLSDEFSSLPFDSVIEHCQDIVRKYYSCFPLLFQIASLLVNHCMLAESSQKKEQILEQALALFIRIKTESSDVRLGNYALNMEAYCLLSLNRPEEVLNILSENSCLHLDSPASLLAEAWQMTGNPVKAKEILQTELYKNIIALFGIFPSYINLCLDEPENFDLRIHTPEEIAGAMCQAELSHEVIVIFSFLPLLTVPAFGAFWVFLITSVLSAMIDLSFAIMQRYNRPRIMKLCKRRKKN